MNRRQIVAIIVASAMALSALACSPYDKAAAASPPTNVTTHGDPCAKGDKACWTEHIRKRANERAWWLEVRAQQIRDRNWQRLLAHIAEQEARNALGGYPAPYPIGGGLLMGSGRCGPAWGLPPCERLRTESRGIINVYFGGCSYQCHPRNTAQGKWAFINRTWAGHRGYRTAALAPEWVQDEKARQLWAGGRGCSHWSACGMR